MSQGPHNPQTQHNTSPKIMTTVDLISRLVQDPGSLSLDHHNIIILTHYPGHPSTPLTPQMIRSWITHTRMILLMMLMLIHLNNPHRDARQSVSISAFHSTLGTRCNNNRGYPLEKSHTSSSVIIPQENVQIVPNVVFLGNK